MSSHRCRALLSRASAFGSQSISFRECFLCVRACYSVSLSNKFRAQRSGPDHLHRFFLQLDLKLDADRCVRSCVGLHTYQWAKTHNSTTCVSGKIRLKDCIERSSRALFLGRPSLRRDAQTHLTLNATAMAQVGRLTETTVTETRQGCFVRLREDHRIRFRNHL